MPILPGDIKLILPPVRTLARNPQTGEPMAAYELRFTIRGKGDYRALVPEYGYTAALAQAAMEAVALPVIETLDKFGG